MFARACPLFLTVILVLIGNTQTSIGVYRTYVTVQFRFQLIRHQNDPILECIDENVACAYLQASRNIISVRPICSCPNGTECPHTWDSRDGHTIPQGSEQFKFCSKVPLHRLNHCDSTNAALMQVHYDMNKEQQPANWTEAQRILYSGKIHHYYVFCLCPEDRHYRLYQNGYLPDTHIVTYTCQKLRPCEPDQWCRFVAETENTFFVDDRCECPQNLLCPGDPKNSNQTWDYSIKGRVHHSFTCK
uniref:SLPTX11 n=1 Tax=Hemiscolopendra marginata TaxID=943146 RepID=A0A646QFD0_9MYRI